MRRKICAQTRPRRTRRFACRRFLEEVLLIRWRRRPSEKIGVFTLNRSAAWLYRRMDGRRTLGQLAEELSRNFSLGYSKALGDTRMLCRDLFSIGAVMLGDERGTT